MILAIDARNASIHAAFIEAETWLSDLSISIDRTADELAFMLVSACPREKPESVWISSVVPALSPRLEAAVHKAFDCAALFVGPGTKTGIKIRTLVPSELGSDIVCAAVAARAAYEGPVIVADFDEVTVLSAVNELGELLGAAIMPGPELSAWALRMKAAQLPDVPLSSPQRSIGRDTKEAVQSGLVHGTLHLVRGLVNDFRAELSGGAEAALVCSGGETAAWMCGQLGGGLYRRNLTIDGLASIARKNMDS